MQKVVPYQVVSMMTMNNFTRINKIFLILAIWWFDSACFILCQVTALVHDELRYLTRIYFICSSNRWDLREHHPKGWNKTMHNLHNVVVYPWCEVNWSRKWKSGHFQPSSLPKFFFLQSDFLILFGGCFFLGTRRISSPQQ